MGLLAIAGMVSGAGNAVNKGLNAMQDDIRRAGLSQEDRDFQMKKLQIQQDFESQREQRGYQHTEQMAKQNQDFQTGLHEGRGGSGNSDSVISGSLASPKPPGGGEPEEQGDEAHETESRSHV